MLLLYIYIYIYVCVCVCVCCVCSDFLIMEEVYRASIPFEEHWGQVTMMKALVGMVTREGTKFEDVIKNFSKR